MERLVLCTGKIYYDIDAHERRETAETVAVARVELLYPFAREQIKALIDSYPNLKEVVWVQEEPRNMGAWKVMSRRMFGLSARAAASATSAVPSAPAPARATRPRTRGSRSGSCSPR